MRRTLTAAGLTLGLLAAASVPLASAQETYTLSYRVASEGACSEVTFTGQSGVPGSEFVPITLADADGDGVFAGSQSIDAADAQQVVQILAGDQVIADPGTIDVTGGRTVTATYTCGDVEEATYQGRVSSGMNLNVRNGPSLGNDVIDSAAPGARVTILCKVRGRTIDGNSLWYRLDRDSPPVDAQRGYWVSARYVDNIGEVPDYCGEGRFFDGRTTAALNYRAGPTTDALLYGTFEAGTEVRPLCKVPGEIIDGNPLWYRLPEGRWASARYIENIGEPPPLCR